MNIFKLLSKRYRSRGWICARTSKHFKINRAILFYLPKKVEKMGNTPNTNMNRRAIDNDRNKEITQKVLGRIDAEKIMQKPEVEQYISMLASTENKKVINGCGELLRTVDINLLILSQSKDENDRRQAEVYGKIRAQVCSILDELLPFIKKEDFCKISITEREAFKKVVGYLREKNASDLLLEIATGSDDDELARLAMYYFVKNREREALNKIANNAISKIAKNIAEKELCLIN